MPRSDASPDPETDPLENRYLTTKQVAALLHVRERKIYDLAAAGEIPGTRALGKWLFERAALYDWLEGHRIEPEARRQPEPPNVVLGSHDPLLEWALRESNSGLASFLDGSLDGLARFSRGEGIVSGLHIFDPESGEWNTPAVRAELPAEPAVLVEWAWRERGLVVAEGNPLGIRGFADIEGKRVAPRQATAGSQVLLEHYLATELGPGADVTLSRACRTETDAALAVLEGEADAAFGLRCIARQLRLEFVPILRERFDLLVWRAEWFEPPFQRLIGFARTADFARRAETLSGYDISGLGTVHFNGRPAGTRGAGRPGG